MIAEYVFEDQFDEDLTFSSSNSNSSLNLCDDFSKVFENDMDYDCKDSRGSTDDDEKEIWKDGDGNGEAIGTKDKGTIKINEFSSQRNSRSCHIHSSGIFNSPSSSSAGYNNKNIFWGCAVLTCSVYVYFLCATVQSISIQSVNRRRWRYLSYEKRDASRVQVSGVRVGCEWGVWGVGG